MSCCNYSNNKIQVFENSFFIYNAFPNDNDFYIINNSWCNFNSFFLKNKKMIIQNLNKKEEPELNHSYDLFFFMFFNILKKKYKNLYIKINKNNFCFNKNFFYFFLKSSKNTEEKWNHIINLHKIHNINNLYFYTFGEIFIDTISLLLSLLYSENILDNILKSWKINISYFIDKIQEKHTNSVNISINSNNICRISPLQQNLTNIII